MSLIARSAVSRTPSSPAAGPCARRRARSSTSAAPAVPPTTSAAAGRAQLRGSRIAESSHASSSSAAISVMLVSVPSRRSARSAGGSTGASASRSSPSKLGAASVMDDLLQLLDRAMDQHLGRTVGAAERARDLAVVHAQREAHDQRLAPVVGEQLDAVEHAAELVAPLHQLLGRV